MLDEPSDHPIEPRTITLLLRESQNKDLSEAQRDAALQKLMTIVYPELRAMARRRMSEERRHHTLSATGLVHEAYLKIFHGQEIPWSDRNHFYSTVARQMRFILTQYARDQHAQKRGGANQQRVPLTSAEASEPVDWERIRLTLLMDHVAQSLARNNPRVEKIIELHYYSGFAIQETAKILNVSRSTVEKEWKDVKLAILEEKLKEDKGHAGPGDGMRS